MLPSESVASRIYDIANVGLIVSLMLGVASTVLVVWMGNVKEEYLRRALSATTERAAIATERAGKAEKEAGVANERASENEKEAARLRQLAADETLARVELQQKVAWRSLSSKQSLEIADKLRHFSGQQFSIVSLPDDLEIEGIRNDIVKTLTGHNGANWHLGASARMPDPHRRLVTGILIELRSDADPRSVEAAHVLSAALNSERIVASGPQTRNDSGRLITGIVVDGTNGAPINDRMPITVTIGKKPQPE